MTSRGLSTTHNFYFPAGPGLLEPLGRASGLGPGKNRAFFRTGLFTEKGDYLGLGAAQDRDSLGPVWSGHGAGFRSWAFCSPLDVRIEYRENLKK